MPVNDITIFNHLFSSQHFPLYQCKSLQEKKHSQVHTLCDFLQDHHLKSSYPKFDPSHNAFLPSGPTQLISCPNTNNGRIFILDIKLHKIYTFSLNILRLLNKDVDVILLCKQKRLQKCMNLIFRRLLQGSTFICFRKQVHVFMVWQSLTNWKCVHL